MRCVTGTALGVGSSVLEGGGVGYGVMVGEVFR
jgi:hypothetical protein